MRKAGKQKECESAVTVLRLTLGYLCLILLFGFVILAVQASIEEKKIRYEFGDKNLIKMKLLDEVREIENQINRLESHYRIAGLLDEHMPMLGPANAPAIELEVPGLTQVTDQAYRKAILAENQSWIRQIREEWQTVRARAWNWLRSWVE